jgi:menaquinone-specific isochorismate synthase
MVKFPSQQKDKIWVDFPDSNWFIPKYMLMKDEDRHFIVINALYYENIEVYLDHVFKNFPEDILPYFNTNKVSYRLTETNFEDWSIKINYALKNISDKTVEKIVLARYIDLELSEQPLITTMLTHLEKEYKDCYTFACKLGNSIFFGSTPEKLFSINDGVLQTDALAGSFPRDESDSIDMMLQNQLLNDKKNLYEHNAVTTFLSNQLLPLSDELEIEKNPVVKKLSNIQHLYTPIKAKIKQGVSIFEILEKLYPTPAVCGIPPQKSKELIEEIENFERGLYAGAIGWIGLNNTAEVYVGIRSAIIKEKHVRAFAGGGIVSGSNSKDEFNETNLKLKPILSLFSNENIS